MGNRLAEETQNSSQCRSGVELTPKEMKAIRNSWKPLSSQMKQSGIRLFLKFFEIHPHYKELFPAIQGTSDEDLPRSLILQAHGISVMCSFTKLVDNLHNPHFFHGFMRQSVSSHGTRGVALQQYKEMFSVMILLLKETHGDAFDEATQAAWARFNEQFLTAILQTLDELNNDGDELAENDGEDYGGYRAGQQAASTAKGVVSDGTRTRESRESIS